MRIALIITALICSGCAIHRPISQHWRFVKTNASQVLIPPGVASPDIARRTFTADVAPGQGSCPQTVHVKGKHVLVTIDRDTLTSAPAGWLAAWAAGVESQGCIAPGEAPKLAAGIAESFPIDPDAAFRVLYPNEIVPPVRLQVVSPILREGAPPDAPIIETSGNGNSLTLTLKSSDNLMGYETALYAVQPKTTGAGYQIAPLYAERHTQQATERVSLPATNYFHFPPGAAFYRLFIKSNQTDFTAFIVAASTRAELERLTGILDAGTASCEKLDAGSCVAIPRRAALNAVVPVSVNGAEVWVRWGANLAEAIRNSGERQPEAIVPKLEVSRLFNGRPTPIDFDTSSPAILRLTLTGGEIIRWTQQ